MKRLLKISINIAIGSIVPIAIWFCLGLIINPKLINIFTITYPIQFLYLLIISIFGTGANIVKEKEERNNIVNSSFKLGAIVSIIIFCTLAINVNTYLKFIGIKNDIYKIFTAYSILAFGLGSVFCIIIEKLYFEEREALAFRYMLIYNSLHFGGIVGCLLITKNQIISIIFTFLLLIIYTIIVAVKEQMLSCDKFDYRILNNIKYESSTIINNLMFLGIFLLGLKNANSFGMQYTSAINFVALITDTQWDSLGAITTVAKVDISKDTFQYKRHLKNAYKLTAICVCTTFLMLISLYKFYKLNLVLVIKYLCFELINFAIWAKYATECVMMQINVSALKSTVVKIFSNITRFLLSIFLFTPFCTAIGQAAGSIIQFIGYDFLNKKYNKTRT